MVCPVKQCCFVVLAIQHIACCLSFTPRQHTWYDTWLFSRLTLKGVVPLVSFLSDSPRCCRDTSLNATYRNEIIPKTGNSGLLNFTNPQVPGPGSSACALNGLTYQDGNAMQEVIGELHELSLWNINVHPYHHHTQP